MKKRKESDVFRDIILRRHREKLEKKIRERSTETTLEKKIRKEKRASETSNRYLKHGKENRMLHSKDYSNIRKMPCPATLCLDTNTDETIRFLKELPGTYIPSRRSSRRIRNYKPSKIKRYFDFTSVKKICPASALIISSCYFIYKKRGGKINVLDWEDWDEGVKDTLTKMGFFELLEFKPIKTDKNLQDIPIKSFSSGSEANNTKITDHLQYVMQTADKKIPMDKERNLFKQALPAIWEASENSVRHAYPNAFLKNGNDTWWFTGTFSSDAKKITLICYDKGISIPRHIKEADLQDKGRKMRKQIRTAIDRFTAKIGKSEINNNLDHKRLEFATKSTVTSTEKDGSGRGLSRIAETINGFSYGEVKIMSRRASAVITKNKRSRFTLLDTPIIGTLIIWKITL